MERHEQNKLSLQTFAHCRRTANLTQLLPELWTLIKEYVVWECDADPWLELWRVSKDMSAKEHGGWEVSMSVVSPYEQGSTEGDWMSFYLQQSDKTYRQHVEWEEGLGLLDSLGFRSPGLTLFLDAMYSKHGGAFESIWFTADPSKTLFGLDLVFKPHTSPKVKSNFNYALIIHGQHASITVDGHEARQYAEAKTE
eukprot:TRINITY_DN3085_c1_g2_i1.p1 TRINITY_DN3085_c1_g2~~TRINITY_DN3085_c1_g2_i1.p1  ORF type:complete len:212 (+),score=33.51 TRINITY_DN3085_c1_g2_i1:51-638(+)